MNDGNCCTRRKQIQLTKLLLIIFEYLISLSYNQLSTENSLNFVETTQHLTLGN